MRFFALVLALSSLLTVEQRDRYRATLQEPGTSVSGDGRYIAFVSYSTLTPADTDNAADVYVLDRQERRVTLESAGGPERSHVNHPRISGDGRLLVYEADEAIVLRDRHDAATRILGSGRQPVISRNGGTVLFTSRKDIYSMDLGSGELRRVSVDMAASAVSATSTRASISDDGRYVAFAVRLQRSRHAAPRDEVFVRDTHRATTTWIATGWAPAVSGDGRYVAYIDTVRNVAQLCVADLSTGQVQLVSRTAGGARGNGPSAHPSISFDGRFVVFQSEANNLVESEDFNLLSDVFILDRSTAVISRLSGDNDGVWMEPSSGASVDAAGTVVAFSSRHATDASDKGHDFDLYVAELK